MMDVVWPKRLTRPVVSSDANWQGAPSRRPRMEDTNLNMAYDAFCRERDVERSSDCKKPRFSELFVPRDYATIQSALDAITDAGRLVVGPGVYVESLEIRAKTVDLKCDHGTVVRASGPGSPALYLAANAVARVSNLAMCVAEDDMGKAEAVVGVRGATLELVSCVVGPSSALCGIQAE